MRLRDCKESYYGASATVSSLVRNLSFAGIAIIWIFRQEADAGPPIQEELIFPSLLFVLALTADFAQYIFTTISWGFYHRYREVKYGINSEDDFEAPRWLNWPQNAMFCIKILLFVWAYVLLIGYLFYLTFVGSK